MATKITATRMTLIQLFEDRHLPISNLPKQFEKAIWSCPSYFFCVYRDFIDIFVSYCRCNTLKSKADDHWPVRAGTKTHWEAFLFSARKIRNVYLPCWNVALRRFGAIGGHGGDLPTMPSGTQLTELLEFFWKLLIAVLSKTESNGKPKKSVKQGKSASNGECCNNLTHGNYVMFLLLYADSTVNEDQDDNGGDNGDDNGGDNGDDDDDANVKSTLKSLVDENGNIEGTDLMPESHHFLETYVSNAEKYLLIFAFLGPLGIEPAKFCAVPGDVVTGDHSLILILLHQIEITPIIIYFYFYLILTYRRYGSAHKQLWLPE